MPRKPFQKGNKLAKGGARPNSGPKPNWFKEQCRKRLERPEVLQLVDDMVDGKKIEPHVNKDAGVIYTEPRAADRLAAVEFLRDTGIGKPASVLDMGDGDITFMGVVRVPAKDLGKSGGVKDAGE